MKIYLDEDLRTAYLILRTLRFGRYLIFFRQLDFMLKILPQRRKSLSSLMGVSGIAVVIHCLALLWLNLLCQPGNKCEVMEKQVFIATATGWRG